MPASAVTEDGNGLYTVTLYYLMPTAMGGYWDLKFMIDGEEAHFYPEVMMAMANPLTKAALISLKHTAKA